MQLASAAITTGKMRASDNHTAPFGAVLPLQVQSNRYVCVSDVVVVVVVTVVVLVKIFVVVVVVAAAAVDVLLFGCVRVPFWCRPSL